MIIILKDADFSANNVGHVDIPVEYSEWTKQVIDKFPNFTWSDDKKNALERFYVTNVESGAIDRMKYLALPMLASNIAEAVQNLSGERTATIGTNAGAKYTIVTKQGIKRIAAVQNADDIISVEFDEQTDHNDFHIMSMPSIEIPSGTYLPTSVNLGDKNDISSWQSIGCSFTFPHAVNVCTLGSYDRESYPSATDFQPKTMRGENATGVLGDQNFGTQAVPLLQNVHNDTVSVSIAAQDYVSGEAIGNFATATVSPYGMSPLRMLLMPLEDSNGNWWSRPYCALSYGKSLTNNQSKIFQNSLMALLLAIKD